MTVDTDGAEQVLEDAFSRFKQSHAEIRRAIETMRLALSERRAADGPSRTVADGRPDESRMAEGGSDRQSSAPASPSISLIPSVDMLE